MPARIRNFSVSSASPETATHPQSNIQLDITRAKQAIGIIETKGFIALIEASDAALKAADIKMTGWDKIGSGLVTGFFTGDVAAVKAGLDAAAAAASNLGTVTSVQVIPRPHDDLSKLGSWIA